MSDTPEPVPFPAAPVPARVPAHCTPDAVLELARREPIVKLYLMEWRAGALTWEQALAAALVDVTTRFGRMQKEYIGLLERSTPRPLVVPRKEGP
jgi:hypothetical protein